jgi:hypothetical protein
VGSHREWLVSIDFQTSQSVGLILLQAFRLCLKKKTNLLLSLDTTDDFFFLAIRFIIKIRIISDCLKTSFGCSCSWSSQPAVLFWRMDLKTAGFCSTQHLFLKLLCGRHLFSSGLKFAVSVLPYSWREWTGIRQPGESTDYRCQDRKKSGSARLVPLVPIR